MDTLIATSSAAFTAAFGFNLDSVTDYMVENLKLIAGVGLGIIQSNLIIIVGIAAIAFVVSIAWRMFRVWRA